MKRLITFILLTLSFILPAKAAVIYSGLQNIPIPSGAYPVAFDGVYVDLDTGATSTSTILGWDVNLFYGGLGLGGSADFQPARDGTGNMDTVFEYELNDVIDGSLLYSSGETGSSDHLGAGVDQFQDGSEGYLGFSFTKNDLNGPYYGWIRLTLTANTPGGVISDWAYEDSGAGILAGAMGVPEPGRAMLLLLGMAATLMRRRRIPSSRSGRRFVHLKVTGP